MRVPVAVSVVVLLLASGCGPLAASQDLGSGLGPSAARVPTAVPTPAPDHAVLADHADDVQALLDEVAAAFLTADPERLRPLLADPDSGFGARWLERASNLADVPLSSYTLELDESGADLTTSTVPGEGGLLVNVVEEHDLEGVEVLGPVRERLFLTLRPSDDGWRVVDDTAAEPLGLVSVDHLWDHGPVVVTRRGALLALHHPEQASVDVLLDEATAALGTADDRWPLDWPSTVPLLVPADQDELAQILHVTFDLSNFIAFATTTPIGELGEYELSGSRVLLNTQRFLERSSATRERILVHELIHAASRPSSSPDQPSWLEEGVAQALGEGQSTTGTTLLDALATSDWDGALPLDAEFSAGDRDSIFLAYQRAWSFVDWLADRYGEDAVGRFYLAAGREASGRPGTMTARIDAAAREVFGPSMDDLRDAWRASL